MSLHIHPDGDKSFRAVVYGGILNDVARAQVAVESVIEQLRLRYCLKD